MAATYRDETSLRFLHPLSNRDKNVRKHALDAILQKMDAWLTGYSSPFSSLEQISGGMNGVSPWVAMLQERLPDFLRLVYSCPFKDLREKSKKILDDLKKKEKRLKIPRRLNSVSVFIPEKEGHSFRTTVMAGHDISFVEDSSLYGDLDVGLASNVSLDENGNEATCSTTVPKRKNTVYACSQCRFTTTSSGNYSRHVACVHQARKYPCRSCERKFSALYDLNEHTREMCSKSFYSRKTLNRHKSVTHLQITKYTCRYCDRKFHDKNHYYGHINGHVGSKPYSCATCKQSFKYKQNLNRHMITCSGAYLDKYKCNVCGEVMRSSVSLKDHMEGKE